MASILDMVQQQLGGGAIDQISQQIGADPGTTQSAVQMALPMLLGGLAHNTTQPGGAEALHTALDGGPRADLRRRAARRTRTHPLRARTRSYARSPGGPDLRAVALR